MKDVLEISATAFKASCLSVFKALEARKYSRVVVTRRGKPIVELTPPKGEVPSLWGCLRGTVKAPPGHDLTEPIFRGVPDAARGILHR